MFHDRQRLSRLVDVAGYAVAIALLSAVAGWSASKVGIAVIGMIDHAVIDGSGYGEQPLAVVHKVAAAPMPKAASPQGGEVDRPVPVATTHSLTTIQARPGVVLTDNDPAAAFHDGSQGTYRTYCVRLCDGYMWPISFSTTSDRFDHDAAACDQSCGSPTRLFVHAMPSGNTATMTTLTGLPYSALPTAFQFRRKYDPQCKCRAHPWEQQATDRHKLLAATTGAKRLASLPPDKRNEVHQLAAKVAEDVQVATNDKKIAALAANREIKSLETSLGKRLKAGIPARQPNRPAQSAGLGNAQRERLAIPGNDERMGLGRQDDARDSRRGWRAATGPQRHWLDRAFSGQ